MDNPSKYLMELEQYCSCQQGLNVISDFNTEELLIVYKKLMFWVEDFWGFTGKHTDRIAFWKKISIIKHQSLGHKSCCITVYMDNK